MRKLGAIVFLLLVACGKRGDPRPPVPVIPKATTDLVVTQRGSKVILAWGYPSLTTAGQSLRGIKRVIVYRTVETLPVEKTAPAATPGEAAPAASPSALFSKIPPLTPARFLKLRTRVDSIEGASLPDATAGARLLFEDTPEVQASDGRPVRLTYAVVTETASARSDLSNLTSIVPLAVPTAPSGLTAEAKPEGIVLAWTKSAAPGSSPLYLAGYNVYREPANQPSDPLGKPVNAAPVTATTYTDVPAYGDYVYTIRALAAAGPPVIESDASESAKATFKDLLPPPAPTGLSVLVETAAVRLVWDPVTAPDLKGYLVYRTEGNIRLKLTPGPDTVANFLDISPAQGTEYVYSVSSVDKSGNESKATEAAPILIPKAP